MKPMNMPGRKNARREEALALVETYRDKDGKLSTAHESQRRSLEAKIVSQEVALAMRTKIDRRVRPGRKRT